MGAVAAGGVAYATIPDGNMIHGCYQKYNGTLRVVDTTEAVNLSCMLGTSDSVFDDSLFYGPMDE